MPQILRQALSELKENLIPLGSTSSADSDFSETQKAIRAQAEIVKKIVQDDLVMLEGVDVASNPLSPLYKSALEEHYLNVVTTLNSALKEVEEEKQKNHIKKLEELASLSKPALKTALYALASLLTYMLSLVIASHINANVALAGSTFGVSLAAAVPIALAAAKTKNYADEFYSASQKKYYTVMAIKRTHKKIKDDLQENKDLMKQKKELKR